MIKNALCLSSDVSVAYDPTFSDVFDPLNSCYIGKGCVLTKYTGSRGKSGSNDASAETMYKVISVMEEENVFLGVSVLSMHAPLEIVSKLDVYEAYNAFKAFYK